MLDCLIIINPLPVTATTLWITCDISFFWNYNIISGLQDTQKIICIDLICPQLNLEAWSKVQVMVRIISQRYKSEIRLRYEREKELGDRLRKQ